MHFERGTDEKFVFRDTVGTVTAIAAMSARIACALASDYIVICDCRDGVLETTQRLSGSDHVISRLIWTERSLIAADTAGTIRLWDERALAPPPRLSQDELSDRRETSGEASAPDPPPCRLPVPLWDVARQTAVETETSQPRQRSSPFIVPLPTSEGPSKERSRYLNETEKTDIINLHALGWGWDMIAHWLCRNESTCRTFYDNWKRTRKLCGQMGKPKSISDAIKKDVIAETERDRRLGIRDGGAKAGISRESCRLARHDGGVHFYKTIPVPPLDDEHKQARVRFCHERCHCTRGFPTVFTDESMIAQDLNKGGIWRRRGELLEEGTFERTQHPISVMVWGAIGPNFRSELIKCPPRMNGQSYVDMLDCYGLAPILNRQFGERQFWWQQDNAPSHRKGWRTDLYKWFESFGWPAYSPDLSPIEHMWAIVKKKLKGRRFADEGELFKAVSEAWDSIEMTTINNLVNSFPARCQVCVEVNGACLNP
jgi:hypothetical protein